MSEQEAQNQPQETGFSADYVKQLREENASWRTKVRDLEAKVKATEVGSELIKRGIKADPKWVELKAGESVSKAIDRFEEAYPHLKAQEQEPAAPEDTVTSRFKAMPRPMPPEQPKPGKKTPDELLQAKQLDDIKNDPKARAEVRDVYRDLLRSQGHRHV